MIYKLPFLFWAPLEHSLGVTRLFVRRFDADPQHDGTIDEMRSLLDREKIRKDLQIVELFRATNCYATGTNILSRGEGTIVVPSGFRDVDKEAFNFTIKHEICHIKQNDCLTLTVTPAVCTVIAAVYGMATMSGLGAFQLVCCVGHFVPSLLGQWRERVADTFAVTNSSNDELKGGRRYFKALREINMERRYTWLDEILFGDDSHPSIRRRIEKIERALRERGVKICEEEENLKIEALKIHMKEVRARTQSSQSGLVGLIKEKVGAKIRNVKVFWKAIRDQSEGVRTYEELYTEVLAEEGAGS